MLKPHVQPDTMPGRISELIYQIGTTIEIVRWIEVASPHVRDN